MFHNPSILLKCAKTSDRIVSLSFGYSSVLGVIRALMDVQGEGQGERGQEKEMGVV